MHLQPQYLLTYPSMVQHLTKKADGDMGSVKVGRSTRFGLNNTVQVMISSGSRLRKELAELFIQRYPSVKFLAQGAS